MENVGVRHRIASRWRAASVLREEVRATRERSTGPTRVALFPRGNERQLVTRNVPSDMDR